MSQDIFATMNAAVNALAGVIVRQGLTEHRLAKRLSITPERLADLTLTLWDGTFSEERDRRVGPNANQQARSQMTRKMQAEIEKVLADGNH
jgi:hypothetical protein